jgi:transcription elongation factor GreA
MKSEIIDVIIRKNPDLAASREKLEKMQTGAFCLHRSWGFGQITGFDTIETRLIVDFEEGNKGHRMDPAFCVDRLEILEATNILVRARTDQKEIEEMIKKRPADLVVTILEQMPDQAASTSELERILTHLLGAARFKKWWPTTKKLLVKDPRVAVPVKKTDPFMLHEEPIKPEEEILEEFYKVTKSLDKIRIAEKLNQLADSVEAIEQDLPRVLEELSKMLQSSTGLTAAQRLHGIWVRNDLSRHLNLDVDQLTPSSSSIICEASNLSEMAEGLPSSYFHRFLDLIARVHPNDWKAIIIELTRQSSGKFTTECMNFWEERKELSFLGEKLNQWLNEQSLKAPLLLWMIKNRGVRKFRDILNPLLEPRFLYAILQSVDNEALQQTGNRRIPLADALLEDSTLISDLLSTSSSETAHDLAQTLILNQGFEPLSKNSLLARFIKCFSGIQSLIAGNEPQRESEHLIVSQKSYDDRKKEYEILTTQKIPENKQAIATAREHGDLRENSEYKMARQDQDTLMARKAQLEVELARARVTNFKDASTDVIGIGNIVQVNEGSTNKAHHYAILGAWDSNPEKHILSYKTPLAQSLIGKTVGDKVETMIGGHREQWTIKSITRYTDNPSFKVD